MEAPTGLLLVAHGDVGAQVGFTKGPGATQVSEDARGRMVGGAGAGLASPFRRQRHLWRGFLRYMGLQSPEFQPAKEEGVCAEATKLLLFYRLGIIASVCRLPLAGLYHVLSNAHKRKICYHEEYARTRFVCLRAFVLACLPGLPVQPR